MKFGPVPVEKAEGKILGHNIAGPDGRRLFRKGRPLDAGDVAELRALGRNVVYVAEVEPGDVDENHAARRVAEAVVGPGLALVGPFTGRVNLQATGLGVARIDAPRLARLNDCDGITLATLANHTPVPEGKTVATVKVIPYAVAATAVHAAEAIAAEAGPLTHVDPLTRRRISLILSASPSARRRIQETFDPPLRARLEALGAYVAALDFVPLEDELGEAELAETLRRQVAAGAEAIILAGETAIMDRHDLAPRAVERAGGEIAAVGAPVDPGNLLMIAYIGDVPILGAPGCARSPKVNVVDWVLPRLLAGDHLERSDVVALGHGGLLEDIPERPVPRSRVR
jgi:molybdenum cofactor cytidylyltransferase